MIPRTYEEFQEQVDANARAVLSLLSHIDRNIEDVALVDWLPTPLVSLIRSFAEAERAHYKRMTIEREELRQRFFGERAGDRQ